MKTKYIVCIACFLMFFGMLTCFTVFACRDAEGVRDGVLRFHVVANSDSDTDQQNKLAVRDGIAELCSSLFGDANGKTEAMATAEQNADTIADCAEEILAKRGCYDAVTVTVRQRYFPTRSYDGVSLPAGVYDTVDVLIGEGAGKNFWCVLFPDICVSASSEKTNKQKLSDVLENDSYELVADTDTPSVRFKFKTVELIEKIKNIFR